MFADMHKLMDSGHSSPRIANRYDHFTRQLTGIGDDTIITDLYSHERYGGQAIIKQLSPISVTPFSSSAPINSHTFADVVLSPILQWSFHLWNFKSWGTVTAILLPEKFYNSYRYGHPSRIVTFDPIRVPSSITTYFINRHKGFYHHIISNLSFRMNIC